MTAMTPVLDLYIDANILLALAFLFWRAARALFVDRILRDDFRRQIVLLKSVLTITVLSPLLAHAAVFVSSRFAPHTPMTISDIAVSIYLKGEIDVRAVRFEAFLNSRDQTVDAFLSGQIPWLTAVAVALAAGAFFHMGRLCLSFLTLHRAISGSYLLRSTGHTDLRISDRIEMPFAARGLFRRHVILPSDMMTLGEDLPVVLAHEFQHIRSGDVEWEMMFELLRPFFFWNPAFTLWKCEFDQTRELSCDQAVLLTRRFGPEDYARCLLKFCERRLNGGLPRVMNVAFVGMRSLNSRSAFRNRIVALFRAPKDRGRTAFCTSLLALAILVTFAAASIRKPGDWSQDRLMLSTIVNLERLELINRASFP